MFTIDQIQAAHAKVASGADFPRYAADLAQLGVRRYVTSVADGHTVYYGSNGFSAASPASHGVKSIAPNLTGGRFQERLAAHQNGETDYAQFREDCAVCGVDRWEVDLKAMTCTYFTSQDQSVLVEEIPAVE